MMDIKQSFAKVTAWAKAHPWLAGGIGLAFVILVIWAIRNKGSGAASIDIAQESEEPTLDLGEGMAGGGSLLDSFTNASGGVTQAPPVYDAPVFDALPALKPMQDAGWFDPGSVQDAVYSAPTESYNVAAMAESIPVAAPAQNLFWGDLSYNTAEDLPSRITTTAIAAPKVAAPKTATVKNQTDSQKVGKGAKFTGYYNGVYYLNGKIATQRAANIPGSSGAVLIGDPAKAPASNKPKGNKQKAR